MIEQSSTGTSNQKQEHQVVCFGEVLWDILPSGPLPGGAPMNVAYHLKKLGINPALITRIGFDNYGEKLVNILSGSGVTTEYFFVDYAHPTGLVYANANDHNEVVYDIVYPSAWDFIEWTEELQDLVEKAKYFVFGSLTCRNKVSRDTLARLLESANTKVLDINLRPPHFRRDDIEFLLQNADILKMNLAELELITGWFTEYQSTEDRAKLMRDKFNLQNLIVTMGADGAMILDESGIYNHQGFKVTVADTIGSGDSFLAGFLSKTLHGVSTPDALEFAAGIGAFIATKQGACPNYQTSEITSLIKSATDQQFQTI